jgi:hypothetical protein
MSAKNKIENVSTALDTSIKVLDRLNLFEGDELVAALPYGKIFKALYKIFKSLPSVEIAINHSVAMAVTTCYSAALTNYKVDVKEVTNTRYGTFEEKLKSRIDSNSVDVDLFDFDRISSSYTFEAFLRLYLKEYEGSDGDKSDKSMKWPLVKGYILSNIQLAWEKIIEKHEVKYIAIRKYQDRKSSITSRRIKRYEAYEQNLIGQLDEKMHYDESMTLSEAFVSPGYELLLEGVQSTLVADGLTLPASFPDDVEGFIYKWLTNAFVNEDLVEEKAKLLLLEGKPGQGKSMVSKIVCARIIKEGGINRGNTYFLELNTISKILRLKSAPLDYIKEVLCKQIGVEIQEEELRNAIFFLDGIEELPLSSDFKIGDLYLIFEELLNEIRYIDGVKFVVTSRVGLLSPLRRLTRVIPVQLRDYNDGNYALWKSKHLEIGSLIDNLAVYQM